MILLAWENFTREYRRADSSLVLWTQTVLIFCLLLLSLINSSIESYLGKNMDDLLGADLVIARYQPLVADQRHYLERMSQASAVTKTADITLTHRGRWDSVQLKAVSSSYPLQGFLKTGMSPADPGVTVDAGPGLGEIWVGPRLFVSLRLAIGDTLTLGDRSFHLTKVLLHEPDRIMEGHSTALRAMIHAADLSATISGETPHIRYLFSATKDQQQQILDWSRQHIPDAQVLSRLENAHPLGGFWARVENFIGLSSVLLFFMGAIAIDLASRRKLLKSKKQLALYLSMGMSVRLGVAMHLLQWFIGFFFSLLVGLCFAWLVALALIGEVSTYFPGITPAFSAVSVSSTAFVLFIMLLMLQIPTLASLAKASVISLLGNSHSERRTFLRMLWSTLALSLLAFFYSDNATLTVMVVGIMVAATLILMLATWLILVVGERCLRGVPGGVPFVFFLMRSRLLSKTTQVLGFGLCCTLLLFTLMLMKDLGAELDTHRRIHDGNVIITKVAESQVPALTSWARENESQVRVLRPFTDALLIAINAQRPAEFAGQPSESLASLGKKVRLSWADDIPANNRVIDGQWWGRDDLQWQQISVESEVMSDLGLSLGDRLTFAVSGAHFVFTIVATHDIKPGGGSITFWFQVPPSALSAMKSPVFYMGSMEVADSGWSELSHLWQAHPSLRLVSIKELTEKFDNTLTMIMKMVIGYSAMVAFMAVLVLVGSVKGFEQDDARKNSLLLSFGLKKSDCLRLCVVEWVVMALIASFGAIGGTWLAGIMIYQSQFGIPYVPDALLILTTLVFTTLITVFVGLLSGRASLNVSVKTLFAA